MKNAKLLFSKDFKRSPISTWVGFPTFLYAKSTNPNEDWSVPVRVQHPIDTRRGPWCQLKIHFNNINLLFSLPLELDHFIDVMKQNPLPSGLSLSPYSNIGRPNRHWLAKLPKQAMPYTFRMKLINYLENCK